MSSYFNIAMAKLTYGYLTLCLFQLLEVCTAQQPSVDLSMGTLHGASEVFSDGQNDHIVNKFLGIPYAQPPVGYRRLQRPEPIYTLQTTPYDATYLRPFCVQATSEAESDKGEDEDCLYLNVFIPDKVADEPSGHAVMVWVYGGGFTAGDSNFYDATVLAAVGNVIVVTFNYRVGFFGFYSTGDSSAPGNYGLYDQAQAFQWVHENIEAFGGDKSRVTIFGESAGSMSVNYHAMYPQNYGRFQRVLGQSGVVMTSYLNEARDVSENAMLLGKNMNCSTYRTYDVVECLKQFSWKDIKNTLLQMEMMMPNWQASFFFPVADGDMVMSDYNHLYEGHETVEYFRSLDFLTGVNMYDGAMGIYWLAAITGDANTMQPTQEDMYRSLDSLSENGITEAMTDSIRTTILHEYTNWTNPHSYHNIRLQFVQLLTDVFYGAPAADVLQLHAGGAMSGNTFAYKFTPATTSRMPWTPSWLPGADHAEDLRFVFGLYFQYMPEWEQTLSLHIMTYWSNFAKSG